MIQRADLTDTYWPYQGEQPLRGVHPRGYWEDSPGAPYEDITTLDPSLGWAAGQLVSTTADLGRFMQPLLGGRLLPPTQLSVQLFKPLLQMRQQPADLDVRASGSEVIPGEPPALVPGGGIAKGVHVFQRSPGDLSAITSREAIAAARPVDEGPLIAPEIGRYRGSQVGAGVRVAALRLYELRQ